ncbi:hypothetical protein Drorol1_Dr00022183, partial [Drosera rotundifolia]
SPFSKSPLEPKTSKNSTTNSTDSNPNNTIQDQPTSSNHRELEFRPRPSVIESLMTRKAEPLGCGCEHDWVVWCRFLLCILGVSSQGSEAVQSVVSSLVCSQPAAIQV